MSQDASALHCPNCGGPAAAGDATCRYCHAALATVSCASCFGLMFEGAAYCPHCGARRARREGGTRTAPCPGCRTAMQEVVLGETDLMECAKCGGIWVDADTFEHICANKEAQAAVLHQWPSPPPANRVEQVHYRPCAACGRMMNRINFERMSGTVIDVCKGHGTFLDAGELHRIVTFIHGGGLERARERQIDDLKSAEARLRAAEDAQAIRDARFDAWHGNRVWQGPDLLELLRRLSRS